MKSQMNTSNKGNIYYGEYPTCRFYAVDDEDAMSRSSSKVLYREGDSKDGRPFVILRNEPPYE